MQTQLATQHDTPDGRDAAALLQSCVHCGFCLATCPTYQLAGDELESPRGRLYLIKQALQGDAVTDSTRTHLDQCLGCRACETTCPSGVQYAPLLEVGRRVVESARPRSPLERLLRRGLVAWLTGPLFKPMLRIAQWLRPALPRRWVARIPRLVPAGAWPQSTQPHQVLLPVGCVQPALAPNIDAATARVLHAAGISAVPVRAAGCCGAMALHLNQMEAALDRVRRNVDAWWPYVEQGVEAIVVNASGCGAMVRDYGRLLRTDARYATRAAQISALVRDPAELILPQAQVLRTRLGDAGQGDVAYQAPCSQQHGMGLRGTVEALLIRLGATVQPATDGQRCCGSAGTYSLLHAQQATQLRSAKLAALLEQRPSMVLSANIGCIQHLAAATEVPVLHWIEWLDSRLAAVTQRP
jgi:glycolate oxidase iron-sulfur subunit